jgi:hypothetical protein
MSVVYLAEHIRLGRKVALKLLAPALSEDESYRERFIRESRRAAELDHPNIIPIYDAGEDDGQLYIAMRYVEGADLKALIKRDGPLQLGRVLFMLEQVAGALDAAHDRDLVHRDVKPSNILVSEPSDRVYLTDFGVVKHTASRGLTKTGFFIGTVDYAPPEQIEGLPLDPRTDVYALGCVFYECLTGRAPFDRDGEVAVMHAHLTEPPPRLTTARPDLPKSLNQVVASAMAKAKDERFGSCEELIEAARDAALQRSTTMRRELQPSDLAAAAADEPVHAESSVADEGMAIPAPLPPAAEAPAPVAAPVAVSAEVAQPGSVVAAAPPAATAAPPTAAPPPVASTPGGGRRRSAWLLTALLVVIAAAGAGIGVYFATKKDSNKGAITNTIPTNTAPVGVIPKGLQGVVNPALWKDCAVENSPNPGAVQSALCTKHADSPDNFPDSVELSLYPNTNAVLAAYAAEKAKAKSQANANLVEGKGRCDRAGWNGDGEWIHGTGAKAGHRFCYFDQNQNAVIVWTHERTIPGEQPQLNHLDTLGIAKIGGKNSSTLTGWWRFWHSDIGKCTESNCVAQLP